MFFISLLIAITILLVGIIINAMILHSQNKSYMYLIKKHANDPYQDVLVDAITIFLVVFLLVIPYVNVIVAIVINSLIFIRGLQEE